MTPRMGIAASDQATPIEASEAFRSMEQEAPKRSQGTVFSKLRK
jgi:hypothetical protein